MSNLKGVDLVALKPARDEEVRKQDRSVWMILLLIAAGLLAVLILVGCSTGSSQATTVPAGVSSPEGATLLETRCSVCHSVDKATRTTKTLEQWDQTVTRMIAKGAKLSAAEKSVLVDYLAENYGP
jgi:hypothetical protein